MADAEDSSPGRGLASEAVRDRHPAPFRGREPAAPDLVPCDLASPCGANTANYNRGRAAPTPTSSSVRLRGTPSTRRSEGGGCTRTYRGLPARRGCRSVQAATGENLNPWTEAKVDHEEPRAGDRSSFIVGRRGPTVPRAIAKAAVQGRSSETRASTEYEEIKGRGHRLVIDHGWRGTVAEQGESRLSSVSPDGFPAAVPRFCDEGGERQK